MTKKEEVIVIDAGPVDTADTSPLSVPSVQCAGSNADDTDKNNNDQNDTASGQPSSPLAADVVTTANNELEVERISDEQQQSQEKESNNNDDNKPPQKPMKLYKSSRLKGYITLSLASYINYDAADQSNDVAGSNTSIPALDYQRRFAMAVALLSLIINLSVLMLHMDRITPAEKIWMAAFKSGSKIEMIIIIFLVIWWSIGVGLNTSVSGIAGDGKGQYSLYYSSWVCCISSYWVLERWWVAAGWSSLRSFISSWPHRSPAWILIMFLSFFTLIWYLDLSHNHKELTQPEESLNYLYFTSISKGQWQLLFSVTSFTFIPSTLFVFAELFRDSTADGKIESKSKAEIVIEGICFLAITLMWIPTVIIATTPGGAASLIGNAYFFTWLLVVVVFEGVVWYIHDIRKEQHHALRMKEAEYRKRQQRVLEQTRAMHNHQLNDWDDRDMMMEGFDPPNDQHCLQNLGHNRLHAISSEFFDAQEVQ